MKKVLIAIILSGLLVAGITAVAKAFLQDIEYVTGNKVLGATLNLQVGDNDPSTVSFIFNNVKPGEEREFSVPIVNTGGVTGNFWFEVVTNNSIEGDNPEPETEITGEGELDDCAEIWINFTNTDNTQTAQVIDWTPISAASTLETFWGNSVDAWVGVRTAVFNLKLRTDNCGPEAMGDGFNLDLVFHLDEV